MNKEIKKPRSMKSKTHFGALALVFASSFILRPSAFAQTVIRISGDSAARYNASIIDSNTQQSAEWIRGDYLTVDVGLFDRGNFRSNNINQFSSVTLQIFQGQSDTNGPMMGQSVTNTNQPWFNTNCSLGNWTNYGPAYTNYNVEFNFSDAQTSINLNGQASQNYWLRLFATTTDSIPRVVTYLEGPVTVFDGPISPLYSAPPWPLGLYVDTNGNLLSPTNFFGENFASMTNALIQGGYSSGGGGGSLPWYVLTNNNAGAATIKNNLTASNGTFSASVTIDTNLAVKGTVTATNVSSAGQTMEMGDANGNYFWVDDNLGQVGLFNSGSIAPSAASSILLDLILICVQYNTNNPVKTSEGLDLSGG